MALKNRILIKNACRHVVDEKMLADKINRILGGKGFVCGVEMSVILVGRKRARDLNIQYRQKNYYPQMLEFPMSKIADEDGYIRLGDMVICVSLLLKDVEKYNKSLSDVLDEWLIHGINNLLQ